MFKNLMLFSIPGPAFSASRENLEEALVAGRFAECGPTQDLSAGWVSPRGEDHGALVEASGTHLLLRLMIERKTVPAQAIKRHVDQLAAKIEAETGRKPGKKLRRELKDQALMDLLPLAFGRQTAVQVWVDCVSRLMAIDTASAGRADDVLTALSRFVPGFQASPVATSVSPAAAMADWLASGEPPAGFTIDRDCELKAEHSGGKSVRYANHLLDVAEVREHILDGKRPARLAMTWQGKVSFVLTERLQVKKIAFLDGVFAGGLEKDERFDADAAIATGVLAPMIGDLIDALDGLFEGAPA